MQICVARASDRFGPRGRYFSIKEVDSSAEDIYGLDYDPNVSNEQKQIGVFKIHA
jgi:hypothetical protein